MATRYQMFQYVGNIVRIYDKPERKVKLIKWFDTEYVPERTCQNVDKIDKDAFFCCSECHEVNHDHSYNPWNYCPNCGAKVVE